MSSCEGQLNGMVWFVDCSFGGDAQIIDTIPTDFELTNQLHGNNKKVMKILFFFRIELKILTRIINTSIFCSANRRAMHDRIPWLNGNTKYGFIVDLVPLADLSQRSGINSSGASKCFDNRHEMKFCVTAIVWQKKISLSIKYTLIRYLINKVTPFGTLYPPSVRSVFVIRPTPTDTGFNRNVSLSTALL